MGTNKPILMERPQRGREMVTQQIAGQQKGKTTLMHEGYVGGSKYLVPDEDLEVMKELVDFKLGKKPADRYVRDYEYTHLKQQPDEKFRKMSQRLQSLSTDDESIASEKEELPVKDSRKIRFEDSLSKKSSTDSDDTITNKSEASEDPRGDEQRPADEPLTETQKSLSSETSNTTGRTQSFEAQPTDVDKLRFLLSGHIRNNLKPIFIFHEYNGKSPFEKTPDFSSTKNEGDVDLYISGKFYQNNILEEVNNKLLSLNIKPEKILIDERSKVYEEQFYQLLRVGKVNIDFQGKFIKQQVNKRYTPFLTFNVQGHPVKRQRSKNKTRKNKPAAAVYIVQSESRSIFEQTPAEQERAVTETGKEKPNKVLKKNVPRTASAQKPEDNVNEYEPHLKKNPSRRPSANQAARRGRDAGDVGSEGGLVYNCDVNRRRSSKDKNIFRRLSHMFFSRN